MIRILKQVGVAIALVIFLAVFAAVRENKVLVNPEPVSTSSESRTNTSTIPFSPSENHDGSYDVVWVTDGDTIGVRKADEAGRTETVRILGINTPEIEHPGESGECFGPEAKQAITDLLTNQQVHLTTDPTQDTRDVYGRLLAYVDLPDGTDVGAYLLRKGLAREYTFKGRAYERQVEYQSLAEAAKQAGQGLWSACE